jgi:hypothetical protein
VADCCEYGTEALGLMNYGECLVRIGIVSLSRRTNSMELTT